MMLLAVAIAILLIGTLLLWVELEYGYFGLASNTGGQSFAHAYLAALVSFAIAIPLGVANRVQVGLQESHASNLWVVAGTVLSVIMTIVGIYLDATAAELILLIYGSLAFSYLCNCINLFGFSRPELRPRPKDVDFGRARQLVSIGLSFFAIHGAFAVFQGIDNILLAHYVGYASVTIYTIGIRLMNLYSSPVIALVSPTLPAINHAIAERDWAWAERTVKSVGKVTILSSVAAGLLFFVTTNPVLTVWLGEGEQLSTAILIAFSIYIPYMFFTHAVSYIMMAETLYREYRVLYPVAAALTVVGKIAAVALYGLQGLLYGTMLLMTIFFILPAVTKINKRLVGVATVAEPIAAERSNR